VEHPGAVAVVAVTRSGEVVFVRQYRYAVGTELMEIPAGTLEPNEDPADCAARELGEETGYRADTVELLASLHTSPGFCTETIHLFLARVGDDPDGPAHPDGDERVHALTIPLDEALVLAFSGRIRDAKTVAALGLAAAALGRLDPGLPGGGHAGSDAAPDEAAGPAEAVGRGKSDRR